MLLAFLICFSLNKNYLFKFEFSIISGSVINSYPSVHIPAIAIFLTNSHPIAPAPTTNNLAYLNEYRSPKIIS